jgi:hypothetical protein
MENGRIDTSVGKLGVNPLISAYTIGFVNYVGELFILLCRRRVVLLYVWRTVVFYMTDNNILYGKHSSMKGHLVVYTLD